MSWLFSQALVEDFSQANCLDGEQFVPLKLMNTPAAYCWHDRTTESLNLFQYGMTQAHSTEDLGGDVLTWCQAGFPAQISASPVQCGDAKGSTENAADYGGINSESSTKSSPVMCGQRTRQNLPDRDLTKSFEHFPSEGTFAGGSLSELGIADYHMSENAFGFSLPTPTSRDWKDTPGMGTTRTDGKTRLDRLPMLLFECVRSAGIQWKQMTDTAAQTVSVRGLKVLIRGRSYSPELPEWLMGWPIGWSDLQPLEMDRYQQWQSERGGC